MSKKWVWGVFYEYSHGDELLSVWSTKPKAAKEVTRLTGKLKHSVFFKSPIRVNKSNGR